MNHRYKILLSNKNIYKEIELVSGMQQLKVGTEMDCDVRLRKDLFFGQIELIFAENGKDWSVLCSDNLYLSVHDARKLMTKNLKHGDSLEVKYQESDMLALTMEYSIDFDDGKKKYERIISVAGKQSVSIGCDNACNIIIGSSYVENDLIHLVNKDDTWHVDIKNTTYGVYVNGKKAENYDLVNEGDFLSISDYFFYFKNEQLWTEIRKDLVVNGLSFADRPVPNAYPKFNRNTRIKTIVCDEKIEILDPPEKPQKPKNNLFMRLLPSIGMLIASGAMATFGGRMIIMSVISGVIAVFTTVMSIVEANKEYKTNTVERVEKYNSYIEKKKEEIENCRKQERAQLEEIYVSQDIEEKRFDEFSSNLFDRVPDDEDYLCVRLGSGNVESKREINYKKQEKLEVGDDLQVIPEQLCEEFKFVQDAPITCDLKETNALGIVGVPEYRFEFLKNLVIDIAARHYHSDVKMIFVADDIHRGKVQWLRFLPHVYNDVIKARNIVCNDESKNLVFEYLYKELTSREQNKSYKENIIVFFYDECGFKSHPISKFVDKAKELGITFIFFGNVTAEIPQSCGYIISILDDKKAELINTQDKGKTSEFSYSMITDAKAKDIVQLLAPVYTEEISLEGNLTKNISMFELLNIIAVDDIDLQTRWQTSQVYKTMAAPLGVSKRGIVFLDLHDKAHGPHGLVAGTTGSGKSEILQTYVLAMSTLFHPYEVGFVIIDFKGGGMVNQFRNLPHLLGAITNIDGKEINRSLKSIKAELQKRQRLFAEADVNHIDKYIRKYKAGEVSSPLPHLIIIVDEFAELKAEHPDFMKELISAARIGRSLGVHLILATQKPSGQVNEQIWSNSRFKLCLKVQSQQDSNEVIKSPLAAEIKEPGRAYLQVGNNEIFELFQSAYSGAPEKADDSKVKEFAIYSLNESGKRQPIYVQRKQKGEQGSVTQLDSIVKYVADYCEKIRLEKLPNICLPALPFQMPFESNKKEKGISVCVGQYDNPEQQYQGGLFLDLAEKNLMIVGSAQTGKTNLLQVIIKSLASQFSPEDVNIYVADFGTMILKNFESLNHVGGVVCANDTEKIQNLFKMLNEEIEKRKRKFVSVGVSSFVSYREAGYQNVPLIVLMVDNIGLLRELYFGENDPLLSICREGLSVGISVIVTNSQTVGIGYKYMANFESKIALYCNDATDYNTLLGNSRTRVENIPGRCVVEIEKELLEAQIYSAFEGEKEYQRVEKVREFIMEMNAKYSIKAKKIPVIPDMLTPKYLAEIVEDKNNTWYVGLNYDDIEPSYVNLASTISLGIVSPYNVELENVLDGVVHSAMQNEAEIYLMDNMDSALKKYAGFQQVSSYSRIGESYCAALSEVYDKVKERYENEAQSDDSMLEKEKLILVLAHGNDFVETINSNKIALEQFKQITTKYKNMKVCFVISGIENNRIPIMGADVLKTVRDNNKLLIMEDLRNLKVIDISPSLTRKYREGRKEYDVYFYADNELQRIKTVQHIQ